MPKICYVPKKFTPQHRTIIDHANTIVEEYAAQGFDLTLRQIYYQFVTRDLISNNDREYKRLGGIINDARLAGEIDWSAINDRTRNLRSLAHWSSPSDIMRACAQSFRVDRWLDQPCRPEVWIEKDALVGVIEGICQQYDVPFFSCRGYTSQSEMWGASQRFLRYLRGGQDPVVFHLGDHDPSGIDMTRDIEDRIRLFLGARYRDDFRIERLALNMPQVEEFRPPPNPTKLTDIRAEGYIERFGTSSWELDALDPTTISGIIEKAIEGVIERPEWERRSALEARHREMLSVASSRWASVTSFLEDEEAAGADEDGPEADAEEP